MIMRVDMVMRVDMTVAFAIVRLFKAGMKGPARRAQIRQAGEGAPPVHAVYRKPLYVPASAVLAHVRIPPER